ncbi:Putative helicase [Invertebrate iridescent virus 30]|uniref:Putative helicase n=1 Tax=Invertebrate iridescent virus 30 TaxID=345585 RepID=W8W1P4_9VIRU|nr:Putative helicase [Invertebrate iridescent virus 30]CCV02218.1 Putative helicase [Invertebrate iridescent virus 30]
MACIIHTNLYDDDVLAKIQKDLTKKIELGNKQYNTNTSKTIFVYTVNEEDENRPCNIPFNYALKLAFKKKLVIERPSRKVLGTMNHSFTGSLREEQKNCRDQALTILQESKSVMLSCYTGFGKTVTAINMASKIKFKTFIVVPKKPLLAQWETEIKKFIPNSSVAVIEPNKINKLCTHPPPDFCIINACNIHKIQKNFLKNYGFVIVDEAHLCLTEKLSENLLNLTPRYLLGITATPYREDGYNSLFDLFFGGEKVKYILNKKHTVYKVKTGFCPNVDKYMKIGPNYKSKLDWNSILDEQSKDEKRNQLIIEIVKKFKDRVFLILVKRVEHGQYLMNCLENLGEQVTSLLGKQQEFNKEARILIGTNSKIGTGFDHPRLDTLLAAADMVSYYIQFIGRIMRRKDVEPIIFDLVDSHPTLKKHFEKRSKVYSKHGGEIVKFKLD